jgi:hypothetical protein
MEYTCGLKNYNNKDKLWTLQLFHYLEEQNQSLKTYLEILLQYRGMGTVLSKINKKEINHNSGLSIQQKTQRVERFCAYTGLCFNATQLTLIGST